MEKNHEEPGDDRDEFVTLSELRGLTGQVKYLYDRMERLAAAVEERSLPGLDVRGKKTMNRAMGYVVTFLSSAQKRLDKLVLGSPDSLADAIADAGVVTAEADRAAKNRDKSRDNKRRRKPQAQ